MKKIWARISMEMYVTDEEYEQIRRECEESEEISDDLASRFIIEGTLSEDSYIPVDVFDMYDNEEETK